MTLTGMQLANSTEPQKAITALESFKAFRGREPSVDALLRHNGMISA